MQRRTGTRRAIVNFYAHNGNVDEVNRPTYEVDADWVVTIAGWNAEVLTVKGGERLRGRQVAQTTSHVLIGDYFVGGTVEPDMRARVNGGPFMDIVYAEDPDGLSIDLRVELMRRNYG